MCLPRTASRAIIAVLLVVGLAGQAAAQMGRVGGIVREESGDPLKGATITAENSDSGQSATATTDAKGRFAFIGLRLGMWRFVAQAPGFEPQAGEMPVRMGTPNSVLTFALKKGGVQNYGPLGGVDGKDLQSDLAAAELLFKQARWDEAAAAYRAVMQRSPTLAMMNLQIAAAYRNKKDYNGAIAAYNAMLEFDPENQKSVLGIAAINVERGDEKAAEDVLLKAADRPIPGRDVLFRLGETKFEKSQIEEAARWYSKAAAADPYWGKPLYMLGLCAMKSGDSAGAAKLMDQVILVDPLSPEAALAKSSLDSLKK